MNEYVTLVTAALTDDAALTEALAAHQRRRPRDQRIPVWVPSSWRIAAVPSRSYLVEAPRPWWEWARAWRP